MRTWRVVCCLSVLFAGGCDNSQHADRPVTSLVLAKACDVQQGCTAGDAVLSAHVQFDAPPRALKPFPVSVRAAGEQPVETVMVTFFMQDMDMGLNRYRMLGDGPSGWRAEVTLPVCLSGRSDWIAEFDLMAAGRHTVLRVPFVLQD